MTLDLGCGRNKRPGTVGVDSNRETAADVIADIDRGSLPFRDGAFDRVLLVHGLEAADHARRMLREVWRVLREAMRTSGMSVLLTSHEMAEVDALASRIAILGGGHVQALGSSQALKDKFGNGCTLSVRLGTANAQWDADELLCRILDEKLPGKLTKIASDAGDHEQWGPGGGSMTFALTGGVQPADILPHLPTLLGHTCDVPVREWQLSLSSLDDVFVRVAEGAAM